ncbi:hypothetical protein [Streptomyces sp. NBC_01497]|uniref:hypothetical protein n=1 Tax=Streptomyces sp. NBC_01497 TaxID=2903885 RepID=UPI002E31DC15|nr:hypothetical protein [Streptomyces sp. NBC_01497]
MPWQRVRFVSVVGLGGAALSAVQYMAVLIALFTGAGPAVGTACLSTALIVTAFARVATGGRADVPYLRSRSGPWVWALTVYTGGAGGTLGLLALTRGRSADDALTLPGVFLGSAACFGLTAAYFLPGVRTRLAVIGATAVFAASTGTGAWAAARPPTTAQWLAGHHVDRALFRLGTAPAGYTVSGLGAGSDAFGATYRHRAADGGALRLTVRRISYARERTAANGCPLAVGRRSLCASDGGGRQRVRYAEPDASGIAITPDGAVPPGAVDELRLRRSGIVYVVTYDGGGPFDLDAARHVLTTLRPPTAAELSTLVRTP